MGPHPSLGAFLSGQAMPPQGCLCRWQECGSSRYHHPVPLHGFPGAGSAPGKEEKEEEEGFPML